MTILATDPLQTGTNNKWNLEGSLRTSAEKRGDADRDRTEVRC